MQQVAPFEILEIPASGAYGAVAVVRVVEDDRVVAVKALRSSYLSNPRVLARARDEARMLYQLRHPNIVRVEELLDVGGRPVVVMEWVEGVALSQLLRELKRMPMLVASELVRLTALALDAAYSTSNQDGTPMRIVHRDIKPDNILLSLAGDLKVVDFGVAHGDFFDRETSTISTVMGTQGYMAPERFDGQHDEAALDVYALGVTLYQMVTGAVLLLPRTPGPHQETLAKRCQDIAGIPCPEAPALPQALAELVGEMCTWTWEKRPTVNDVQMRLSAIILTAKKRPDLATFALQHVVPVHNARPKIPPQEHVDYPDMAFLEQPWETLDHASLHAGGVPTTFIVPDTSGDRRVRRFFSQRNWASQERELKWLLARNPNWTATPFLEMLDDPRQPWWKFWSRGLSASQLTLIFETLRYRKSDLVRTYATKYANHSDARVAAAVQDLL